MHAQRGGHWWRMGHPNRAPLHSKKKKKKEGKGESSKRKAPYQMLKKMDTWAEYIPGLCVITSEASPTWHLRISIRIRISIVQL